MSDEAARGLPTTWHLELRDAAGSPLLHRMIAIDHLPRVPGEHTVPVETECREANVPYSEWYLHAAGHVAVDAREV